MQVQIAGLAAVDARLALAGQLDLLTVLDAGGHMSLELLAIHGQGHGRTLDRLTKGQADLGVAVLAVFGARGFLIAVATGVTVCLLAVAASTLPRGPTEHREDVVEIGVAAARSGEADTRTVATGTLAKHGAEDVGEAGSVKAAGTGTTGKAGAAHAELANRVVLLAIFLLAQHVVGFGDVLELLLGFLGLVDVRVVLAGELAVRLFDVVVRSVLGDTKDFVEVFTEPFVFSHSCLLS